MNCGPGESRTPDERFRNWVVIPQLECFQCLWLGRIRAVLGSVGTGTCDRSCNIGRRGWPMGDMFSGAACWHLRETLLKEEPPRCDLKNRRNQDDQILRLGE